MSTTKESVSVSVPMSSSSSKSRNLPADCSKEEFEQTWEFLKQVKEIDDQDRTHRGMFLQYINVMKLYQFGSLNVVDVKNRVATIFKNCDVLLDGFHRLMKSNNPSGGGAAVVVNPSYRQWAHELLKTLSEELRLGFAMCFKRFKVHENVQILKEEVDLILRDYPCAREEFRLMLVQNGLIAKCPITAEEEDELFESDMYYRCLQAAIRFAEDESDPEKPPSAAVYGAITRFYAHRRKPFKRASMRKNPRLAVQSVLPALKRKYLKLEEEKATRLVRCRNDSVLGL